MITFLGINQEKNLKKRKLSRKKQEERQGKKLKNNGKIRTPEGARIFSPQKSGVVGIAPLALLPGHKGARAGFGRSPLVPDDLGVGVGKLEGRGVQHSVLDDLKRNPLEHGGLQFQLQRGGDVHLLRKPMLTQLHICIPHLVVAGRAGNLLEGLEAGDTVLEFTASDEGDSHHQLLKGITVGIQELVLEIPESQCAFLEGELTGMVLATTVELMPVLFGDGEALVEGVFDGDVVEERGGSGRGSGSGSFHAVTSSFIFYGVARKTKNTVVLALRFCQIYYNTNKHKSKILCKINKNYKITFWEINDQMIEKSKKI